MKSSKTLAQRRSLAAKRGWDSRRKKKLDAAWAGIAERAKTAPVIDDADYVDKFAPAGWMDAIDRTHREREAQSKHPGSAPTNDHREYAPELLLTEGMRVKKGFIRDLIDRFVKRLGARG